MFFFFIFLFLFPKEHFFHKRLAAARPVGRERRPTLIACGNVLGLRRCDGASRPSRRRWSSSDQPQETPASLVPGTTMGVTPSWKKRLKASHGCSGRTCSRFCGRAKVIIGLRPALRAPTTFDVKGLMYGQVGLFWLSLSFIVFSRNNPLLKWEKTKDKDH